LLIGFCIFKYFPHGGIQRDLLKIANECLRRGHQVRVYTLEWRGEMPADLDVRVIAVRGLSNHRRYARFHQQVTRALAADPVDLLVGMNKMPGLDVYYAGDSCFEEKVSAQRSSWYRLLPRYRLLSRFEKAVFARTSTTKIMTISDVERPHFEKHYGTPPTRFFPLPPGIEKDRLAPADTSAIRRAFRDEFELSPADLLLLFVGSGFRKKGLDRVLNALAMLPVALKDRVVMFVLGSDNAQPFARRARQLGLAAQVRFFPGRDDVPRFLFSADALVLPAYDEAAGMIILEAMFAGLPALVSANCGYAHYLEAADAGLISPLPFVPRQFEQQLVELLTSERREQWSSNGRAAAANREFFRLAEVAVDYLQQFAAETSS